MKGRKRKYNPDIPAHIPQGKLPSGLYWADGRWYVLEQDVSSGKLRKRTIAGAEARLADLWTYARQSISAPAGSLRWLVDMFLVSTEYHELAQSTQRDYRALGNTACQFELRGGRVLGDMPVAQLTLPTIQRLVEAIACGRNAAGVTMPRPALANYIARFLRRLFGWGMRHGHCRHNPASGVRQVRTGQRYPMPSHDTFQRVLQYAMRRAALPFRSPGASPAYLPAVMVLAYNLRLRGIEVITLTDAHRLPHGVRTNRRKGSRDNITRWNREMRRAWACLVNVRRRALRKSGRQLADNPAKRWLVVTHDGQPLHKSSLDSAWQRMIRDALATGIITPAERFSLHGLKHRGVTDTVGNVADKQAASGHVDPRMVAHYDHEIPTVAPPKRR